MQIVQISTETFARLQAHAVPLVDTIETVINRALDALDLTKDAEGAPAKPRQSGTIDPSAPPSLSFTTVRSATIAGKKLPRQETFWNAIMMKVINIAAKSGLSPRQISDILVVNHVVGVKEKNGYKYLKDAGISVQGQDANGAWKATYQIAKHIRVPLEVSFVWQPNPKAASPGQLGKFLIS